MYTAPFELDDTPGLTRRRRSKLAGFLSRRNTASHRCIQFRGTGRSPSAAPSPGTDGPQSPGFTSFSIQQKNGCANFDASAFFRTHPYVGITQIRFLGRSWMTPSQPAHKLPNTILDFLAVSIRASAPFVKSQGLSEKNRKNEKNACKMILTML